MTIPNERSQPVRTVGFETQSQRVADCEADCTAASKLHNQSFSVSRAEALSRWLTIAAAAGLIAYISLRFAGVVP